MRERCRSAGGTARGCPVRPVRRRFSQGVVRSNDITASSPDEKDPLFAPSGDKVYRHPTFYEIPDNVPHM